LAGEDCAVGLVCEIRITGSFVGPAVFCSGLAGIRGCIDGGLLDTDFVGAEGCVGGGSVGRGDRRPIVTVPLGFRLDSFFSA